MTDVLTFEEFYRATRQRVFAFLLAVTGHRAEAQDAAQEAYARAWQRWDRLRSYDDPEAWVRMVAYRVAIGAWRRTCNRLLAYHRHGAPAPAEPAGPERVADRAVLDAALRRLPTDQRLVLVMHHLLDLSVDEIAAQTGMPVGTVKTRLVRGRRKLAAIIDGDRSEEARNA
jgi:RNA polymerase sigma-70 factor (ECF subfamily)